MSVVDQKGETLSSVGGATTGSASEQATSYEDSTSAKVQADARQGARPGQLDRHRRRRREPVLAARRRARPTRRRPALRCCRRATTRRPTTGSGASGAAGVLGTDTHQHGGEQPGTGSGANTYTSDQGVKNNAINETSTTQTITPGTLTRQSIAVAVERHQGGEHPDEHDPEPRLGGRRRERRRAATPSPSPRRRSRTPQRGREGRPRPAAGGAVLRRDDPHHHRGDLGRRRPRALRARSSSSSGSCSSSPSARASTAASSPSCRPALRSTPPSAAA